jgi:glycosyltransferase involved in cell wall biosynthesis
VIAREVNLRILLIANFKPDRQESMARFCELVRCGMARNGDDIDVLRPEPVFTRLLPDAARAQKWLGYIDKFLLFPFVLRRAVKSYEMIHICDHSNSMYTRFLRGKPSVVTCHDLLAVRSALGEIPENPTGWSGRVLQRSILRGLQRAHFIVCVSEETKRDLLRLTRREAGLTSCVHNGLNYPYSPMRTVEAQERVRPLLADQSASGVTRPFFLHVGGNQWYKNRLGVLKIFACLRERREFSRRRLVMVGKPFTAEMRSLVASRGLSGDVVELTSLPNEDLRALYSLAEGLLFPSLAEGFGWPIVEAQACGCPVFTTNRPPMNEIGGAAALYFDPGDPNGAAAAIGGGIGQRGRMAEQGLENAKRFGAEGMLRVYREIYARASG